MQNTKKIVIVGATSAIAERCARRWLEQMPIDLTLVGRDARRVERVAMDLRVRSPQSEIRVIQADFLDPVAIDAMVGAIAKSGPIDVALIAHGSLPEQTECQTDLLSCRDALEINGVSPVLFAEAFAKEMEKAKCGTLALIGSVAGDRGRKSNYVYGAAKGMVTRFLQGLRNRLAKKGVQVLTIKPGFVDTPMTAAFRKGPLWAQPEAVARGILAATEGGKNEVYLPGFWWLIMAIIRHIPEPIFKKLSL